MVNAFCQRTAKNRLHIGANGGDIRAFDCRKKGRRTGFYMPPLALVCGFAMKAKDGVNGRAMRAAPCRNLAGAGAFMVNNDSIPKAVKGDGTTMIGAMRNRFLALWAAMILACLALLAAPVAAQDVTIRGFVELDRPLEYGEYFWDEKDVPPGEMLIVADLDADQMYIYRGGYEIGRSTFIQGSLAKSTPEGVYPILEKDADHYSSIYDNAPMPHMLRLTWDGIAIHGSAVISDEFATRGCIGLPKPFAAILFNHVRKGTKVIVTRRWKPEVYW